MKIVANRAYKINQAHKGLVDGEEPLTFRVPLPETVASVTIDYPNGDVATSLSFEVSPAFVDMVPLVPPFRLATLPQELQEEVETLSNHIDSATRRVLELMKYHWRYFDISEQLLSHKNTKLEIAGKAFDLPSGGIFSTIDRMSRFPLNKESQPGFQAQLDNNMEPLLAMRHLHRAKKETMPHYKWIDATIASELAIKEVLIRAKPELEELLLNLPSPPLTKLYGSILEFYLGERSPHLSSISIGVEIRNKLVHSPRIVKLSHQSALDYVSNIEAAVFHLLLLLYPKDPVINKTYSIVKSEAQCATKHRAK